MAKIKRIPTVSASFGALRSATWVTILQQIYVRFSFASTYREFLTMCGLTQRVRASGLARKTPCRAIEFAAGRNSRAIPQTRTHRAPAGARASHEARGPASPTLQHFWPFHYA